MGIPRYDEIQLPALEVLKDQKPRKRVEVEKPLIDYFKLTEEETAQMYDSGNGPIFTDRVQWALSYLNMAGLVQKPKRGVYEISAEGLNVLANPKSLKKVMESKLAERDSKKKKEKSPTTSISSAESDLTPEESLYNSYEGIRKTIYREILDTILSKSPREFEKLVVHVLQKMGYGGEVKNSGQVTQYSNDGGIDGIIKEDILGFGRIHIQAKRYSLDNNVPREDIQKFVGALAVAQSDKGVFITTSDFTKGAYQYTDSLNSSAKIVLINGTKLANYIYDYNIGMQTEKVIELKKLDSDYWDEMIDDEKNN